MSRPCVAWRKLPTFLRHFLRLASSRESWSPSADIRISKACAIFCWALIGHLCRTLPTSCLNKSCTITSCLVDVLYVYEAKIVSTLWQHMVAKRALEACGRSLGDIRAAEEESNTWSNRSCMNSAIIGWALATHWQLMKRVREYSFDCNDVGI